MEDKLEEAHQLAELKKGKKEKKEKKGKKEKKEKKEKKKKSKSKKSKKSKDVSSDDSESDHDHKRIDGPNASTAVAASTSASGSSPLVDIVLTQEAKEKKPQSVSSFCIHLLTLTLILTHSYTHRPHELVRMVY